MSSKVINSFLRKGCDPLRSFRGNPYPWDKTQPSDAEADRNSYHQRYQFPDSKPESSKPAYVPHILDHRTEAAKVGFDPEPAPETTRGPLTWQAEMFQWLFIFLGLLGILVLFLVLSQIFGGIVELVLVLLLVWWLSFKVRKFLDSEVEWEVES